MPNKRGRSVSAGNPSQSHALTVFISALLMPLIQGHGMRVTSFRVQRIVLAHEPSEPRAIMLTRRTFPQWTKNNNARLNRGGGKKNAALKNGAGLIYQPASLCTVLSLYRDSSHRSAMAQALMVYLFTGHNKYNWHLQWCQASVYRRPPLSPPADGSRMCVRRI